MESLDNFKPQRNQPYFATDQLTLEEQKEFSKFKERFSRDKVIVVTFDDKQIPAKVFSYLGYPHGTVILEHRNPAGAGEPILFQCNIELLEEAEKSNNVLAETYFNRLTQANPDHYTRPDGEATRAAILAYQGDKSSVIIESATSDGESYIGTIADRDLYIIAGNFNDHPYGLREENGEPAPAEQAEEAIPQSKEAENQVEFQDCEYQAFESARLNMPLHVLLLDDGISKFSEEKEIEAAIADKRSKIEKRTQITPEMTPENVAHILVNDPNYFLFTSRAQSGFAVNLIHAGDHQYNDTHSSYYKNFLIPKAVDYDNRKLKVETGKDEWKTMEVSLPLTTKGNTEGIKMKSGHKKRELWGRLVKRKLKEGQGIVYSFMHRWPDVVGREGVYGINLFVPKEFPDVIDYIESHPEVIKLFSSELANHELQTKHKNITNKYVMYDRVLMHRQNPTWKVDPDTDSKIPIDYQSETDEITEVYAI